MNGVQKQIGASDCAIAYATTLVDTSQTRYNQKLIFLVVLFQKTVDLFPKASYIEFITKTIIVTANHTFLDKFKLHVCQTIIKFDQRERS